LRVTEEIANVDEKLFAFNIPHVRQHVVLIPTFMGRSGLKAAVALQPSQTIVCPFITQHPKKLNPTKNRKKGEVKV